MLRFVLLPASALLFAGCFPKGVSDTGVPHDTFGDTSGDSDTDTDADTDADSDSDADTDTDADSDTDADTDTDADSDTDADTDTDSDSDADRSPGVGELVITEVMSNPDPVDDAYAEWFEVYNASPDRLSLDGLTLSDLGTDTYVISGAGSVAPGAYFVIGRSSDPTLNGGVTVDFTLPGDSGFTLANDDDEILISLDTTLIDEMTYLDNQPAMKGHSWSLDASITDATGNDGSTWWCDGTSVFGTSGMLGTPGAANDPCTTSSTSATP